MLCVDDAVRAVTGTVVQPLKDPVQCRGELGDPIRVLVVDDNPGGADRCWTVRKVCRGTPLAVAMAIT